MKARALALGAILILALALVERPARAEFAVQPCVPVTGIQNGIPVQTCVNAIQPVASASAGASLVVKAAPGNLYWAQAANATATAGFCLVIDATSAPTSGSSVVPKLFATLPASGTCTIALTGIVMASFLNGITVLVSSNASPFVFTSGVITAAISAIAE